jgi:3-hydroxyacyl-CoA dehydrogenase
LLAEAFRLVGEGYCSPQDLDRTLAEGLGRRWSFMGPFETIELNAPGGIPDYCTRYTDFYRHLQAQPAPPEVWDRQNWSKVVAAWGEASAPDEIARKTLWRNERLAALAAHLKQQQPWKK